MKAEAEYEANDIEEPFRFFRFFRNQSQFGTPRKQGSWSIIMPLHIHAMRAKQATLNKRVIGLAKRLFPIRMVRTIGITVTMNATERSHNKPYNMKLSGFRRFI